MEKRAQALQLIRAAERITFLTGAGVSVPSGIPDYRSIGGVYEGLEEPEYLLSYRCLQREPAKFYDFVKRLYHPEAQPNACHLAMAELARRKESVRVVTQNIDQLHQLAGSQDVVNFHGNLYDCYCSKCLASVSAATYLQSDRHEDCGGQLRPAVVLYGEGLAVEAVEQAIEAVATADVLVIVGTSFRVHPFCDLVHYLPAGRPIIVVNREEIMLAQEHIMIKSDVVSFFSELSNEWK